MKRIIFYLFLLSCNTRPPCYEEANYPNYTQYNELPIGGLDQALVDSTTQNVVNCLAPLKEHWLSDEEASEAQCYGGHALEIRSCLQVRLAPDWYVSKCSGEQLFPCNVPFASCALKGQVPTEGCWCHCRAMIQDNTTIIVTPNLRLYPAYLTTLLTGCNYPWTKSLAKCSDNSMIK
jgi:hypothetical protein